VIQEVVEATPVMIIIIEKTLIENMETTTVIITIPIVKMILITMKLVRTMLELEIIDQIIVGIMIEIEVESIMMLNIIIIEVTTIMTVLDEEEDSNLEVVELFIIEEEGMAHVSASCNLT